MRKCYIEHPQYDYLNILYSIIYKPSLIIIISLADVMEDYIPRALVDHMILIYHDIIIIITIAVTLVFIPLLCLGLSYCVPPSSSFCY